MDTETQALLPVESIALTVAKAQSARGDSVPPNTAAMLVMTIERLTGRHDWTQERGDDLKLSDVEDRY